MNCREFATWLDAGAAGDEMTAAQTHLLGCAHCRTQESAALELEELLLLDLPPAPNGLVRRVMARLADEEPVQEPFAALRPALPWWRASGLPSALGGAGLFAAALVALVARSGGPLATAWAARPGIFAALPLRDLAATLAAEPIFIDPSRRLALALALLPVTLVAAVTAYSAMQRWTRRHAAAFTIWIGESPARRAQGRSRSGW